MIKHAESGLSVLTNKKLTIREGPRLRDQYHIALDYEFPERDDLSYENHIVGVV